MDRSALFLLGFAITLALTAAAEISGIHVGGEVEHTAATVCVMALAAFPAYSIASRIRSERILLLWWLITGAALMGMPRVAIAASWIAARGIDPIRGDWHGLLTFAFVAFCAIGPFALLLLTGLFARLEQLARSSEPGTTDLGPALALLGASAALACGPYLIAQGLGAAGCGKFAGALFMVAVALRYAAGGPERLRESAAAEHFESNVLLCSALVALGMAAGRACAFLDVRGQGTEGAAFVGPLATALVGFVFLTAAAPFVEPNRLSGHLACGVPRFVFGAGLGRLLPRPEESTLVTLSALLATCAALIILGFASASRRGVGRTRIPGVVAIALLVLGFGWTRQAVDCEPDGATWTSVTSPIDGRARPYLEGAPLLPLDVDPGAAIRAVTIALAHVDAPARCAVLGVGGAPFAEALARASAGSVTFVTPLAHEALATLATAPDFQVVNACERLWLERANTLFDVILLAPPARTPRRISRRSTVEFGALASSRVNTGGVVVQSFHIGSNEAVDLFQKLLPTAGFAEYRVFLDHPGNPAPFLLRIVGRGSDAPFLEHARDRLTDLARSFPELERYDFDLRTLIQCFAFDRPILDLWYRESWINTDDRSRLGRTLKPPRPLTGEERARLRAGIEQRRISLGSRLRGTVDGSALFSSLADTIPRDHDAAREVSNFALERTRRGEIALPFDFLPNLPELDRLLAALIQSPNFPLVLRPIDRARRVSIDRGQPQFTYSILQRMLRADPLHPGWQMEFADAAERLCRVTFALASYRALLERDPEHASANLRLAYVLASRGRNSHPEAIMRLDRAIDIDAGRLDPMDVVRARFVRAMLQGDLPAARELDARIAPSERVGPLIPVLRLRLLE